MSTHGTCGAAALAAASAGGSGARGNGRRVGAEGAGTGVRGVVSISRRQDRHGAILPARASFCE